MKYTGLVFFCVVLGVFAVVAQCTDIDRCEVGSEGCLCTKNEKCNDGLGCSKDEALIKEGDVVLEDVEERGLCLRVTCLDNCESPGDGNCDDGGEGSDNDNCDWGTDCKDCGERFGDPPGNPMCTDTCATPGDGSCDDGGKGHDFATCDWGTDCTDCGPRYGNPPKCLETCETSKDGPCDDGGEGSDYSTCDWGTDCEDCGPRYGEPPTR